MAAEYQTVSVERRGQVDWLTLNRPDSLNAINVPMVRELADYFGRLYNDAGVRIVVMRGAGRAFSAGLDIKERQAPGEEAAPFGGGFGFQGFLADVYLKMRRCPQPIISLVHGPACGGGFAFALASDIRIAGQSARMNAAFIRLGLSACDIGVSYFLPRMIGSSAAAEFMLTLSAPASKTCAASLAERMPPPTQKGTKSSRAVRRTVSSSVCRPSCVAVMSSSTISSAPSRAWRAACVAGSPASMRSTNCTPLTTRPPCTSRQAIMRLVITACSLPHGGRRGRPIRFAGPETVLQSGTLESDP